MAQKSWTTLFMERKMNHGCRGLVVQVEEGTYEWSIEAADGMTLIEGTAEGQSTAVKLCTREAAKRQLVDSGTGVSKSSKSKKVSRVGKAKVWAPAPIRSSTLRG